MYLITTLTVQNYIQGETRSATFSIYTLSLSSESSVFPFHISKVNITILQFQFELLFFVDLKVGLSFYENLYLWCLRAKYEAILREGHKLKVFETRVLRRNIGHAQRVFC